MAVPAEPVSAPVLPAARLEPGRVESQPLRNQELELPALELPRVEQTPLDYGRPAGGVAGYNGGFAEIPPPVRRSTASRRSIPLDQPDLPIEHGASRFDEPDPHRSFPVALVSLMVVVVSGAVFLSWRMGLWEPVENPIAADAGGPSSLVAKTESISVGPATENPVASRGALPNDLEEATAFSGADKSESGVSAAPVPPGPQPLASLGSTPSQSQRQAEIPPRISDPRLAVAPPEPVQVGGSGASSGTSAPLAGDTPLERVRDVIRKFLEASSWRERVDLISVAGDPAATLSSYYERNADLPIQNYRLDFFHMEESESGEPAAYIFFLTLPSETDGFPVMVLVRNGEYRIDWSLYVEFRERAFQEFVEEKPAEARRFRVVLQRVTYGEPDREEIPGVDQLLCYKIDPPYPGMTRFAFVDKEKPIGKQMARELSWEADPLAAEVELKWAQFPDGKQYLTIEQMVARSWVRTLPAAGGRP